MNNSVEILLIEDNPADIRLTKEAFAEVGLPGTIHVVQDGIQAISFLCRKPPFQHAPRPHLILLDLNLPKKDGREILSEMKTDPRFLQIPVVVLTTSDDEVDVWRSYNLHANAYLVKPIDVRHFIEMIQALEKFWLSFVKLPPQLYPL
jgi:two-component system, chemotaxis family, response regulator Rcp1